MSEDAVIVVSLTPPDAAVEPAAAAVIRWLRDTGVVVENPDPDWREDIWQPTRYLPGPAWPDVTHPETFPGFATCAPNGVEVCSTREMHHPVEAYEPPQCPRCGVGLAEPAHWAAATVWFERGEPDVACSGCGWHAPLGDWPGEGGILVGAPSVTFHNWPVLREPFVAELRARLGGRTALLHQHT